MEYKGAHVDLCAMHKDHPTTERKKICLRV